MVRSAYTLLRSTLRVDAIAKTAKELGYDSVALCDVNVLHGAMAFRHACARYGIKAIYGMEVECVLEKENEKADFVVLAQNDEGFQQLLRLSTWINTEAETIIEKYSTAQTTDNYLFPILHQTVHKTERQRKDRIKKVLKSVNGDLRKIGSELGLVFPLTTYVARRSYASVLKHAGVDTDTNGAVSGALMGARMGYAVLPETWVAELLNKDLLAERAEWLAAYPNVTDINYI